MWTAERWGQAARRLLLALAVLPGLAAAQAEGPHARVELLADVRGVLPGQPFALGVRFKLGGPYVAQARRPRRASSYAAPASFRQVARS